MAYLEDCIMPNQPAFNDFEAIGSYEELVLAWAEFQYNNPELFTTIIADPTDCTPTSELEEYTPEEEVIIDEECRSALLDFLATYGITLTKEERLALLTSLEIPDCRDQEAFDLWILENVPLSLTLGADDEQLSPCELALLLTEHRSCVSSLRTNRTAAFSMAGEFFGGLGGANGCGDAFRHAFFNALNARDCGIETARAWGAAHECGATNNASSMDLYNNEIGYYFGIEGASNDEIAVNICEVLSGGYLHVLSDVSDPDSEIIDSDGCSCD